MFDIGNLTSGIPTAPRNGRLCKASKALVETTLRSIECGDWTPATETPFQIAEQIKGLLETGTNDAAIGMSLHDLVGQAVTAIAVGEWEIGAEDLDIVFDAGTAIEGHVPANDDPAGNAVAI